MNICKIVSELKKGNIVIAKTDTVYGIYADATNLSAVKKVFNAKSREKNKPLLILVSSLEMLKEYVSSFSVLRFLVTLRNLTQKYVIWLGQRFCSQQKRFQN